MLFLITMHSIGKVYWACVQSTSTGEVTFGLVRSAISAQAQSLLLCPALSYSALSWGAPRKSGGHSKTKFSGGASPPPLLKYFRHHLAHWKVHSGLPVSVNWTFLLALMTEVLQAKIDWKSAICKLVGHHLPNFRIEGDVPTNHFCMNS